MIFGGKTMINTDVNKIKMMIRSIKGNKAGKETLFVRGREVTGKRRKRQDTEVPQ
jgi:hypothetical protein